MEVVSPLVICIWRQESEPLGLVQLLAFVKSARGSLPCRAPVRTAMRHRSKFYAKPQSDRISLFWLHHSGLVDNCAAHRESRASYVADRM